MVGAHKLGSCALPVYNTCSVVATHVEVPPHIAIQVSANNPGLAQEAATEELAVGLNLVQDVLLQQRPLHTFVLMLQLTTHLVRSSHHDPVLSEHAVLFSISNHW